MSKSTPRPSFALGQAHRKQINRGDLALWDPEKRRHDPLQLLAESTRTRVQSLLPLKTERMAASAFGFFRGAAPVMAYDLSLGTRTAIINQICGDAHVENLGAYTGLDDRLVFDINDFDETLRAPFEWDLKRMATSLLLAGAEAGNKPGSKPGNGAAIKPAGCQAAAEVFLEAYTDQLHSLAAMPVLAAARFQVHRLAAAAPIAQIFAQAERSTPTHLRDRLTIASAHDRVFRSEPPLLRRVTGAERAAVLACLPRYRKSLAPESQHLLAQFQPQDVAFKVVGTGSVGMRDFIVYLEATGPRSETGEKKARKATGPRTAAEANDPLFLQIKEETASAYAPYLPASAACPEQARHPVPHNGQRVVDGQRAMQLESDPLLGWTTLDGRDYLVRQLNDHKASLDVTTLDEAGLTAYAQVCGELLARGHARSGEAARIAGYLGSGKHFRKAILDFATAYADQTNTDWQAFVAANQPAPPETSSGKKNRPPAKTNKKKKSAATTKKKSAKTKKSAAKAKKR